MQHIFITDPFAALAPGHDSSLALIREALSQGEVVYQAQMEHVSYYYPHIKINAQKLTLQDDQARPVEENPCEELVLDQKQKTIIWMRKDPPVDLNYLRTCELLKMAQAHVINNPTTLMSCDEKLLSLEFPSCIPETFVSQNIFEINELLTQKKKLLLKPIGLMGGRGIVVLEEGDKNNQSLIELLTHRGTEKIIVQEYLPKVVEGDKRVILLDGKPIGSLLRVPHEKDHRANMVVGSSVAKAQLTPQEKKVCDILSPRLQELGLYFVGLDFIGEKLTEINITSPTGLEEIAKLDGVPIAKEMIQWSVNYFS